MFTFDQIVKAHQAEKLGIHQSQIKFIFRDLYFRSYFLINEESEIIKKLGHIKLNKKKFASFRVKVRTGMARNVLNLFYSEKKIVGYSLLLNWFFSKQKEMVENYFNDASSSITSGNLSLRPDCRTSTVFQLLRDFRSSESFKPAILADALEDAGFGYKPGESEILEKYR